MGGPNFPCKSCKGKRPENCHASCQRYIKAKKEHDEKKQAFRKKFHPEAEQLWQEGLQRAQKKIRKSGNYE